MHANIKKLEELTANLPLLTDLVASSRENTIHYEVEGGACAGQSLLFSGEVAVQRATASKGTIFPRHLHAEHEFVILISGEFANIAVLASVGFTIAQWSYRLFWKLITWGAAQIRALKAG